MIRYIRQNGAASMLTACCLALPVTLCVYAAQRTTGDECVPVDRPPRISPDYSGVVVPPNIAAMNFVIRENAAEFRVVISSKQGQPIELASKSPKIRIPAAGWRRLLDENRSGQLHINVSAKTKDGKWSRFQRITNTIAAEDIDDYLVYRRIAPDYSVWSKMGVYQRDLRSFKESVVLDNGRFQAGCVNCHTFCNNRTEKMFVHTRSSRYGSSAVLVEDGLPQKIGTKFGYTSWHPSGRLAAYSVNKVTQFFHAAQREVREVIDLDSLIAYYCVDEKQTKTAPALSRKDRLETYPTWSPDGRYLYFCSAPLTWSDQKVIPEEYDRIRYDLVRVGYDIDSDTWGEAEQVLGAEDMGRSILLPRISPDGRWLLVSMCDYGCFPVYRQSSDLYMIDLQSAQESGQYNPVRLEINSDASESWHSWSSNGRWIAFSSKRDSGVFTRIYFSYVDENGVVHKPLVLPQEDPTRYDSCLWTFSVPELVIEPVRAAGEKLGRVVRGAGKISEGLPVTAATPRAIDAIAEEESWLGERE